MFKNTLFKNISALTLGNVFTTLLGAYFLLFFTGILDENQIGKYYFLFSLFQIAILFGDIGVNTYFLKEWPRQDSISIQKSFSVGLSTKVILSAGIGGFFFLFGLFHLEILYESWLIGVITMLDVYKGYFQTLFSAHNNNTLRALIDGIEKCILVGCGIVFLLWEPHFTAIIWAFLLSKVYSVLHCLYANALPLQYRFDWKSIHNILRQSWVYFFIAIFVSLYFRIDSVMLKYLQGFDDVGFYNIAYSPISMLSMIPEVILLALFPTMSVVCSKNPLKGDALLQKSYYYLLLLTLPLTVGGILTSESILVTFFGDTYLPSHPALQILFLANMFVFVNYILAQYLFCTNRQKIFLQLTGILALGNIVLNFIFIPYFSFVGAAMATLITECINAILLRRYTIIKISFLTYIKIFIPTIVMGIFTFVSLQYFSLFITIFGAITIYGTLCYFGNLFEFHSKRLSQKFQ